MWRDMRFRRLSAIDVGLAQHNHVVQQFPSTATNPALRHAVLPGTPVGRSNQLAAEAFQHPRYVAAEFAITIKDQVPSTWLHHPPGRLLAAAARSTDCWDAPWH